MKSVMVALFCMVAMVAPAVQAGAYHCVGDDSGWSLTTDFASWASNHTIHVGDALEFKYNQTHGVQVVNKDDFDNCNTNNPGVAVYGGTGFTFIIGQVGPIYFICQTPEHCQTGMKLAIIVLPVDSEQPNPSSGGVASGKSNVGSALINLLLVIGALVLVLG